MKIVFVVLLVAICISLAVAMFHLARDSGQRDRTRVVKSLSLRIGLSLLLFVLVVTFALFGEG